MAERPAPPATAGGTVVQAGGREFAPARLGPCRVVSIRHIGPYHTVDATWARLRAFVADRGLYHPGALAIGIVYDNPVTTPPDAIRYDACLSLDEAAARELARRAERGVVPGIRIDEIDSGPCWRAVHLGPYDRLAEVYAAAGDVAAFTRAGLPAPTSRPPMYEVYRNDPLRTPPHRLCTEVYFPHAP